MDGQQAEGSEAKKKVLFVCIFNSVRSQMSEGILRDRAGSKFEVFSAGVHSSQVNPYAVEVMREIGIDISHQESKTLDRYMKDTFDYVITVCDMNSESCPTLPPAKQVLHWSVIDPNHSVGDHLEAFRKIRDILMEKIVNELVNK